MERRPGATWEERARALAAEGRAAWPGIALAPEVLARHLAARAGGDGDAPEAVHAADLYLACACAEGIPAAIEAFDRIVLGPVPAYVAGIGPEAGFGDEVRQILREKLLVAPPGGAPKIAEYAGRGALTGWVRVAATRIALNLKRDGRRDARSGDGDLARAAAAAGADPELDLLKARYRGEFEDAVRAALGALDEHQRTLLRLSIVEGLSLEAIGALYRVHLSTVSRRLGKAREAIAAETHRLLRERLRLTPSELASLEGLVLSQIDVSLGGILNKNDD